MKLVMLKNRLMRKRESGYVGYIPQSKFTSQGKNTNIAYLNWPQPR